MLGGANPDGHADVIRYPFAPPVGIEFVLWDSDAAIERWINAAPTAPVTTDRQPLYQVVAECRRRGFAVDALTELGAKVYRLLTEMATLNLPDTVRSLVGEVASTLGQRVYLDQELAATNPLPINLLAAPVYNRDGSQQLAPTMHIGGILSPVEIQTRGTALRTAADAVTASMRGAPPAAAAS